MAIVVKVLQNRLNNIMEKCSMDFNESERDSALEAMLDLREECGKNGVEITYHQISIVMKKIYGYCERSKGGYPKTFVENLKLRCESRRDAVKKLKEMGEL